MKKLFLINAILTGVLVCLFLTSGNEQEVITYPYCTHEYEDGLLGRYIVPNKYREYQETGGYFTGTCPEGLYFDCRTSSCVHPSQACDCVKGL